jgi:hypothetical protein
VFATRNVDDPRVVRHGIELGTGNHAVGLRCQGEGEDDCVGVGDRVVELVGSDHA